MRRHTQTRNKAKTIQRKRWRGPRWRLVIYATRTFTMLVWPGFASNWPCRAITESPDCTQNHAHVRRCGGKRPWGKPRTSIHSQSLAMSIARIKMASVPTMEPNCALNSTETRKSSCVPAQASPTPGTHALDPHDTTQQAAAVACSLLRCSQHQDASLRAVLGQHARGVARFRAHDDQLRVQVHRRLHRG